MMARMRLAAGAVALALLAFSAKSSAELQVSLEISGSVEEIIGVLQHLRQAGVGHEAGAEGGELKLEVHSTAAPEGAPESPAAEPAAAEAPAPAPTPAPDLPLAFNNVKVEPGVVAAGEVLRVSVQVTDKENRVDTVAANLRNADKEFTFDLFDNGSHGDDTAGDGIWSVNVAVPGTAVVGDYTLTLFAYDAAGARLTLPGPDGAQAAVSAQTTLSVQP